MVDKDLINQGGDEGTQVNKTHPGKAGPSFVGGFIPIGNAGMAALKVLKSPYPVNKVLPGNFLDQTDCTEVSIPTNFAHASVQSDRYFFKPFNGSKLICTSYSDINNFTIKDLFVGMRFKHYNDRSFGYVIGFTDNNFDDNTKVKLRLYSDTYNVTDVEYSFGDFNVNFEVSLEDFYGMSLSSDYEINELFSINSTMSLVWMGFVDSLYGNWVIIESVLTNSDGELKIKASLLSNPSEIVFEGTISESDFKERFLLPLEYTNFLKIYGDYFNIKFGIVDGKLKMFHNMISICDLKKGDFVWISEEGVYKFANTLADDTLVFELYSSTDIDGFPLSYSESGFKEKGMICYDSIREEIVDSAMSAIFASNHKTYENMSVLSYVSLLSNDGLEALSSKDLKGDAFNKLLEQIKLDDSDIRINHIDLKSIPDEIGISEQIGVVSLNIRGNKVSGIQIPEFMKGMTLDQMHFYMKFKKIFEDSGYMFGIDPAKLVGDVFQNNWIFMGSDFVTDQDGKIINGLPLDHGNEPDFITHLAKLGSKILSIQDVLILTHIVYLKFGDKIDKLLDGVAFSENFDPARLSYDISKFLGISINENYDVVDRKIKHIGIKGLFHDIEDSNKKCFIWKGFIDIEIPKDPYYDKPHEHTGVRYVF